VDQAEPVTIVITRIVRAGREAEFEEAVKAWIPVALAHPGHLGVHMLRPMPGQREYGAVLKFRSRAEWEAFREWPDYQRFLATIHPLLDEEPMVQAASGLESWFTPLGTRVTRVPPRWKMALVTWLGVCIVVYLVSTFVTPLFTPWPWLLGFLAANAVVVAALTWVVMPGLNRLFHRWLRPDAEPHGSP
jgi:antibiotic biosynthesis monooxygenase (ABM) superfamily enzyme